MLHNSLKALRCRLNMTQEQLARRSGATRRTILDIEQGRRAPSTLLAYRLAAVLGIPVTELFSLH